MSPSHDPTYPLFPTFAFLGFFLCMIPLPWHMQAWNAGTCAFMIWTGVACLIEFINAIIWRGNINNVAPVWCDISSKLILGVGIGIPASTLCITRRLYNITAIQTVSVSRGDKRRTAIGDIAIAAGVPALIMILHIIVQPHRFDILEDVGCYPAIYNTLPAYFLYWCWPVILGAISFIYSCLNLRTFWIRRAQFEQLMSNSSMNASRYLRLMLLALIDIMFTIPLGVYVIYIGNKGVKLYPWVSWDDTHFNFGRVVQTPTILWRSDPSFQISVELTRWLPVFCALLFFTLFGFASEAKKQYSLTFWWIAKRFGLNPSPSNTAKISLPEWKKSPGPSSPRTFPIYVPPTSSASKKYPDTSSLTIAGDDHELHTYTTYDIEKSAGLCTPTSSTSPPEYCHSPTERDLSLSSQPPGISSLPKPSSNSLRTVESNDRIYISDTNDTLTSRTRTPSPAPFADIVTPPYHHPLTLSSTYPVALPHHSTQSLDVICVTVHTQSQSTAAL